MTTTLIREDTGTHAVVRVIDAGVHVSAPYSRAVGILDKWVRAERKAADELAAWIEGQTAQAAAEMRSDADEQLHQHRQFRLEMAERIRREGTVNLPPVFEEIAPAWVELPEVADPLPPVLAGIRARYGPVDGRSPFDTSPAPDEAMPGRAVVLASRDNPLAAAYAKAAALAERRRAEAPNYPDTPEQIADQEATARAFADGQRRAQGWTPDPNDYGEAVVRDGVDWRAEWAAFVHDLGRPLRSLRAWWRAKQAQRDQRMGVNGDD